MLPDALGRDPDVLYRVSSLSGRWTRDPHALSLGQRPRYPAGIGDSYGILPPERSGRERQRQRRRGLVAGAAPDRRLGLHHPERQLWWRAGLYFDSDHERD